MTEVQVKTRIFPIRGTVVLISLVLPLYFWSYALVPIDGKHEFSYYLLDVMSLIAFQMTAAVLMFVSVKYWQVDVMHMWQRFDSKLVANAFQLTVIQLLFSMTSVYVIFYLLSLYFPEFITALLELAPPFIIYLNDEYNLLLNTLYFFSVVLLAPIVEEFVFRGLLLRRWSEKWNPKKAMIVSSLIFAIFHGDPIGAFIFGLVMCHVYFISGSLWLPIVCHALNNFIVWLLTLIFMIIDGPNFEYDIETVQSDWYIGLITGLIGLIWLLVYCKKNTIPAIPTKYPI